MLRRPRRNLGNQPIRSIAFIILCAILSTSGQAQKVVVQDAGGGNKQELVYDTSGKMVETRTLNAKGTVVVRNTFDFKPGFIHPQRSTFNYWADTGKVEAEAHDSYDQNSNFLSEVTAVFDKNGKQNDGHTIEHNPATGVYHCGRWNNAEQRYMPFECPAGEEENGPAALEPLAYQQLVVELRAAKQNAAAQRKSQLMGRKSPTRPATGSPNQELALILPAEIRPADRVTATLVKDLRDYEAIPELSVLRVRIPSDTAEALVLSNWTVEMPGEKPQRADGPITFTVPTGDSFSVELRNTGDPSSSITRAVSIGKARASGKRRQSVSETAPLCFKKDTCVITGDFDPGDSFVSFGSVPAILVAGNQRALFVRAPDWIVPGPQHLMVAGRAKLAAFTVCVAELRLDDATDSLGGEPVLATAALSGVQHLPEQYWRGGTFPTGSLGRARKLVPGFHLAQAERRKEKALREGRDRDSEPEQGGMILMVIRASRSSALRGAQGGMYVFYLGPESFKRGEFRYRFVIEDGQVSNALLTGAVVPFLAPIAGQFFPLTDDQ